MLSFCQHILSFTNSLQYLIIGDNVEGEAVGRVFWTLPHPGTPCNISDIQVVPTKNSLEVRWRGLPCIPSYVVRICGDLLCQDSIVWRDDHYPGEMVTTVMGLQPCTMYSVIIGTGPTNNYTHKQDNTTWVFIEEPVTTVAYTSQVS